ncbi:hypothetical protein QYE76_056535 [Lolium multiflorum]|uniref:Uncharacterized protein n=1 Tax=Lolium multiflorum TaxID=4521 RepID=A0AAD8T354_LOLMU|nr:hypothetical protein QYE76_056535 [Lolium multiflorum]
MVPNNKDKEPLKENIQDPELKKEDAREDEEEVEEAPQEHQQATVASIGVISNPSNIKRSARIATGGAVPRHYLAPRTSSPSNYNPYRNLIYDRQTERTPKGALPPALDLDSFPCVEEAIRVADEFCDQYRALRREVEILQEENQRLRRMLEYYSIPSTRPSPPPSDNNKSFQILVQNCKIEKLKLKEILMKREKNPSPSSPKE